MISQGEIYSATLPRGQHHFFVVVSREELNRGNQVVAAMITSANFEIRSRFANCVPILGGTFGMRSNCVIQCENLVGLSISKMDSTPIGRLDSMTMRDVVRALGYLFDADCEPN